MFFLSFSLVVRTKAQTEWSVRIKRGGNERRLCLGGLHLQLHNLLLHADELHRQLFYFCCCHGKKKKREGLGTQSLVASAAAAAAGRNAGENGRN